MTAALPPDLDPGPDFDPSQPPPATGLGDWCAGMLVSAIIVGVFSGVAYSVAKFVARILGA